MVVRKCIFIFLEKRFLFKFSVREVMTYFLVLLFFFVLCTCIQLVMATSRVSDSTKNMIYSPNGKILRAIPFQILREGADWKISGTPLTYFYFFAIPPIFRRPPPMLRSAVSMTHVWWSRLVMGYTT